ncbi:MAG: glycoside hydrolase family 2 protein [Promethearchaeota archaeon]
MVIKIDLVNQPWFIHVDPKNEGENEGIQYGRDWFLGNLNSLKSVKLPHSWQTMRGLERYEGVCWYFCKLPAKILSKNYQADSRFYLHFNGVNYKTKVWFAGEYLGENEGGFLPFTFHIRRSLVKKALESNKDFILLCVKVDNTRRHGQIPGVSHDWFPWGGIYRDVYMTVRPEKHVKLAFVTPILEFDDNGNLLKARVRLILRASAGIGFKWVIKGPAGQIVASGDYRDFRVIDAGIGSRTGRYEHDLLIDAPKLWDPTHPRLYTFLIHATNSDEIHYSTRFGLRQVEIKNGTIYLNGKPIKLLGVSLHEEKYPFGREYPRSERRKDLIAIKSIGFNFVRTAHYSHDEALIECADEIGILIGEEIPVYWDIDFSKPRTQRLAVRMLKRLVFRDYNHPSIIWWSVGNEIPVHRRDCQFLVKNLLKIVKNLDQTRICCFVTKNFISDPLRRYSDIVCFNGYLGWYFLTERMWDFVVELIHETAPKKPLIISEFGAGAKYGFGRSKPINKKFTEWKQASILSYSIKTFNAKRSVNGWVIWIYRDFKSHMRLNKYQGGYNRKGIVDERDRKKLIAIWMPKLVKDTSKIVRAEMVQKILAKFYGKFLWVPAKFFGLMIDLILPKIVKSQGMGYFRPEPADEFFSST